MPRRGNIAEAAVIVSADTEKFERQMKGDVQDRAVEGGRRVGRRFSESMSQETRRRLAAEMPDNIERISRRAGDEAEQEMGRAGRRAGERLGEEAAEGARSGFQRLLMVWRRVVAAGIVAAAAFAAQRVVRTIGRGLRRAADLIERGGERRRLREAFENLATAAGVDPVRALEQLQEATRNTQTEFELLERASTALQAGLPATGSELAEIAGLTRRLAQGSLVDANEAFRRFINGVIRGRRILLDDIGIIVDFGQAHQDFADKVDKSVEDLTEQEKIQARLNATLNKAQEVVARQGEEVDNAALSLERIQAATRNWLNRTTELLAQGPQLSSFLRGLADDADAAGRSIEENAIRTAAGLDVAFASIGRAFVETARLTRSSALVIVNSMRAIRDAMTLDFASARESMERAISENLTQAWESFEELVTTTPDRLEKEWRESVQEIRRFIRESREETQFEATLGRQFGTENLEQLRALIGSLRDEQEQLRSREGDHQERIQRLQGLINAAKRREAKIESRIAEERNRLNQALQESAELSEASEKLIERQLEATARQAEEQAGLTDFVRAMREELEKASEFRDPSEEPAALGGVEQRVRQAQRDLEPLLKDTETSAADVLAVLDEWDVTIEDIRDVGVSSFADLVEEVIRLRSEGEESSSTLEKIAGKVDKLGAIARGLQDIGEAAGFLSDEAREALDVVIGLAEAGEQIAKGNVVGGVIRGVGAIAKGVSSLFGGSAERAREQKELARSLRELRRSAEALRQTFERFTGEELGRIRRAFSQFLDENSLTGRSAIPFTEDLESFLSARGTSLRELIALGESLGLTLDDLKNAAAGNETEMEQVRDELEKLDKAMKELSLERLTEEFAGQMQLLEDRFELFDIEDPIEKLDAIREKFLEFAELPGELEGALAGADLSTAEGRERLQETIRQIFRKLESGELSVEDLGGLTPGQLRETLKRLEGLEDEISEEEEGGTTESFQVSRQITEVTGNRLVGGITTLSVLARHRNRILMGMATELGAQVPKAVTPPSRTSGSATSMPPETQSAGGGGTTVNEGDRVIELSVPKGAVEIHCDGELTREDGRRASRGFWEETNKQLGRMLREDERRMGGRRIKSELL